MFMCFHFIYAISRSIQVELSIGCALASHVNNFLVWGNALDHLLASITLVDWLTQVMLILIKRSTLVALLNTL